MSEKPDASGWRQIADDVVMMSFPFRVFGIDFARNVTLLRLGDGRVVIHSTARFTKENVTAIREFGEPWWLVDATLLHDTFAKEGRAAFIGLPYLAPAGFTTVSGIATHPLNPAPSDWAGEIEVLKIEGTKKNEHALFHRRSRTLVVCDMFLSFPPETRGWARFFARRIMGVPPISEDGGQKTEDGLFGVSRFFRFLISDKEAFAQSVRKILDWDFDRVIVAHREPVVAGAKSAVERALREVISER